MSDLENPESAAGPSVPSPEGMGKASKPRRRGRFVGAFVLSVVIVLAGLWGVGAVYWSNLPWALLRTVAAVVFGLVALMALLRRPRRLRPMSLFLAAFVVVLVWWWLIPPSNGRDWSEEAAIPASATIDGDEVTIFDVRNFDYDSPTDYTSDYYDRTYDLSKLKTVDFIVSYFGPKEIAHTLLSFGFEGGEYLAISVEVRKEEGEGYSPLKGLFKQYELIYVVGDERDVIRLRTNFRGEQVYVYPTTFKPEEVRALFESMIRRVNKLAEEPEWYNTLVRNCTTSIVEHVHDASPRRGRYNWRILLNGYSDELAYDRGRIDTDLPFADAKKLHHVNELAKLHGDDPDFSQKIRAPWLTDSRSEG